MLLNSVALCFGQQQQQQLSPERVFWRFHEGMGNWSEDKWEVWWENLERQFGAPEETGPEWEESNAAYVDITTPENTNDSTEVRQGRVNVGGRPEGITYGNTISTGSGHYPENNVPVGGNSAGRTRPVRARRHRNREPQGIAGTNHSRNQLRGNPPLRKVP